MTEEILALLHFILAFFLTYIAVKFWIRVAKKNEITGRDMNKYKSGKIPEAGGIAVIISFCMILLLYIFFKTFVLQTARNILETLALLVTVLLACFIGFIDDIIGRKEGFRKWQKFLITIPIAIPLIVINVGNGFFNLPLLGMINFGLLFPLVIIPLGILATTNAYNLLAGYNGLEAGLGIILFSLIGFIMFLETKMWLSLIAFVLVICLLAFLKFNKFPAKVFPGDSLTYPVGALVAVLCILGNLEKVIFVAFFPFVIEVFLKLRGKLQKESFAEPNKDNSLELKYDKIYGLEHFSLWFLKKFKKKVYEKDVVYLLYGIELIFCFLALIYYLI